MNAPPSKVAETLSSQHKLAIDNSLHQHLDALKNPVPKKTRFGSVGRLVAVAILVAALGFSYRYFSVIQNLLTKSETAAQDGRKAPRPIPVNVAEVEQRNIDLYLNALGTVTAFNTVTIKSRVDGELTKVVFKEGEIVQAGDLLAELDARPFIALRDQSLGQLNRDKASLELARLNENRLKSLLIRAAASQQEYDEQEALLKQAQSTLQVDQANLENAQLQVDYTKITAPISGRIGLRLVDQGNIVKASDPTGLCVITQLQPISLVFAIPQDEINRIQKQSSNSNVLEVEAYDRNFEVLIAKGELKAVDNQVDSSTGTLKCKAIFQNEESSLFPNQFINTKLKIETLRDALVVPSRSVQRGPNSQFVYVVKSDKTVEVRDITTGPSEGTFTVIKSGLEKGDRVVIEGIDKLQPGAQVSLNDGGPNQNQPKGS